MSSRPKEWGFCSWWCAKEWCDEYDHKQGTCLMCGEKMGLIEWDNQCGFCSKECLQQFQYENGYLFDGKLTVCMHCMREFAEEEEDNVGKYDKYYDVKTSTVKTHNYVKCTHNGATKIGKIGKCELWAGSRYEIENAVREGNRFDLVFALEGTKTLKVPKVVEIAGDVKLKRIVNSPYLEEYDIPTVAIKWKDYDIPDLGDDFWADLIEDLKEFEGKVAVFCVGGHGRTGTFLSVVRGLVHPKGDPIRWVRKNYCERAVESKEQIEYVEWVTGLESKEKPSKDDVKVYSYNQAVR